MEEGFDDDTIAVLETRYPWGPLEELGESFQRFLTDLVDLLSLSLDERKGQARTGGTCCVNGQGMLCEWGKQVRVCSVGKSLTIDIPRPHLYPGI